MQVNPRRMPSTSSTCSSESNAFVSVNHPGCKHANSVDRDFLRSSCLDCTGEYESLTIFCSIVVGDSDPNLIVSQENLICNF
jgi:hypothetical protein